MWEAVAQTELPYLKSLAS